ncbi:MAG: hypothetical protein JHC54_11990 [Acinetobacter sp.]|nr:hypothetical protein [Acinetobacter sp.]
MPRPDQQPAVSTVTDATETYSQQDSGVIKKWTVGQLRAHLQDSFGDTVVSGAVVGNDVVLSLASGDTVTINGVVFSYAEHYVATGVPSGALGKLNDTYTNATNGDVYKKEAGGWSRKFDFGGTVSTLLPAVLGERVVYVNNQCTIVATGGGITFVRNSPAVWTINVPVGVELMSADIYSTDVQNPGANVTINLTTASTMYNQGISTLRIPLVDGVNLGAGAGAFPANYAPTTGSVNLQLSVLSCSNGDVSILINNFNAATGLGAGATLTKLKY